MLIIRDLLRGAKRFSQLERSLVKISPRTLSLRMKQLEKDGIVTKKVYPVVPPHTEYSLTNKGHSLALILGRMIEWGDKYVMQ
jgi:DNA-binding HxlR family transcriptional regulator